MERIIVIYKNNLCFPIQSIKLPERATSKTDITDKLSKDIFYLYFFHFLSFGLPISGNHIIKTQANINIIVSSVDKNIKKPIQGFKVLGKVLRYNSITTLSSTIPKYLNSQTNKVHTPGPNIINAIDKTKTPERNNFTCDFILFLDRKSVV